MVLFHSLTKSLIVLALNIHIIRGKSINELTCDCSSVDISEIDGLLAILSLTDVPSVESMIGGFKCPRKALPFGALKSDWARLLLLQEAQPEQSIIREKFQRIFRILVIAFIQREELFDVTQSVNTPSSQRQFSVESATFAISNSDRSSANVAHAIGKNSVNISSSQAELYNEWEGSQLKNASKKSNLASKLNESVIAVDRVTNDRTDIAISTVESYNVTKFPSMDYYRTNGTSSSSENLQFAKSFSNVSTDDTFFITLENSEAQLDDSLLGKNNSRNSIFINAKTVSTKPPSYFENNSPTREESTTRETDRTIPLSDLPISSVEFYQVSRGDETFSINTQTNANAMSEKTITRYDDENLAIAEEGPDTDRSMFDLTKYSIVDGVGTREISTRFDNNETTTRATSIKQDEEAIYANSRIKIQPSDNEASYNSGVVSSAKVSGKDEKKWRSTLTIFSTETSPIKPEAVKLWTSGYRTSTDAAKDKFPFSESSTLSDNEDRDVADIGRPGALYKRVNESAEPIDSSTVNKEILTNHVRANPTKFTTYDSQKSNRDRFPIAIKYPVSGNVQVGHDFSIFTHRPDPQDVTGSSLRYNGPYAVKSGEIRRSYELPDSYHDVAFYSSGETAAPLDRLKTHRENPIGSRKRESSNTDVEQMYQWFYSPIRNPWKRIEKNCEKGKVQETN